MLRDLKVAEPRRKRPTMAANPKRDDEEQPPRAEQVVCRYFQSKEHVNVKRWRWRASSSASS